MYSFNNSVQDQTDGERPIDLQFLSQNEKNIVQAFPRSQIIKNGRRTSKQSVTIIKKQIWQILQSSQREPRAKQSSAAEDDRA